jgi:hypothetical protein
MGNFVVIQGERVSGDYLLDGILANNGVLCSMRHCEYHKRVLSVKTRDGLKQDLVF